MPHVVVDVRMARHSGIGTYIRNLVPRVAALESNWRFTLLGMKNHSALWAGIPNASFVGCASTIYGLGEQLELPLRVPRDASVVWSPHFNTPLWHAPGRRVVTIHDMGHLRLSEHLTLPRQLYARVLFRSIRRRAAAVIFVSEFTRREFGALVGEPAGRSTVVHHGIDAAWSAPDSSRPLTAPYLVFVGNLKPHKNLKVVLEAMRSPVVPKDCRLAVIGRAHGMRTVDDASLATLRSLGERVVLAGEVTDDALRGWVQNAVALVFPSRYEGFGFPPLEAMAAGIPAIVSQIPAIEEVCGDAALYFRPDDAPALARHIARLCSDAGLRRDLRDRGRTNVMRFSWDAAARQTRDVLGEVA